MSVGTRLQSVFKTALRAVYNPWTPEKYAARLNDAYSSHCEQTCMGNIMRGLDNFRTDILSRATTHLDDGGVDLMASIDPIQKELSYLAPDARAKFAPYIENFLNDVKAAWDNHDKCRGQVVREFTRNGQPMQETAYFGVDETLRSQTADAIAEFKGELDKTYRGLFVENFYRQVMDGDDRQLKQAAHAYHSSFGNQVKLHIVLPQSALQAA